MKWVSSLHKSRAYIALGFGLAFVWTARPGPAATIFQYNIIKIENTKPWDFPVVTFSVTDPSNNNQPYDIKTGLAFTQTASGASRLFIQIGWDTRDYTNTTPTEFTPRGDAAALPIPINGLAASVPNGDGTFRVISPVRLPTDVRGTGVVAMEGHPAAPDATGAYTVRVQVKSVFRNFLITGGTLVSRRNVVDINKCKVCHGVLSTHGNNRTDEPQVCVICHNPNATDISFRLFADGPEVPIDFKRMVHAIHAAEMRKTPLVIIGRNHSINDFSQVKFPAKLRNCLNCHLDNTFGLPLGQNVLATTVATGSFRPDGTKILNNNPADDSNITATAAVCSACHDDREARQHMVQTGGASFSALQQQIDSGLVKERCVSCHGPGKKVDVRKVHLDDD